MKREKSFYHILVILIFMVCYITSLILACRNVSFFGLSLTAACIVYPITYFISVLYAERYGIEKAKMLVIYAIFSLIAMVLLITLSSLLPVNNGPDGLEKIFNIDYRLVFASIASFFVGQHLCLEIYYYLSGFKGFKFLMASVIAVTVDTLIFIVLSFLGELSFGSVIQMFTSQYIFYVIMVIILSVFFTYIINAVIKTKKNELDEETKPKKITKKTTTKKTKKVAKK